MSTEHPDSPLIQQTPVRLRFILGAADTTVEELQNMIPGAFIELDRRPIDGGVVLNEDTPIGEFEVVPVGPEWYGARITRFYAEAESIVARRYSVGVPRARVVASDED